MGAAHTTKKKFEPVGPFDPPLPDEAMKAEGTPQEPMAVSGDKVAKEESFKATTQQRDQMARGVAEKFADPNLKHGKGAQDASSREEDRRQQRDPPGYRKSEQTGYVEMDTEE